MQDVITETDLLSLAVEIGKRTRKRIDGLNCSIDDYQVIANEFGIEFGLKPMPLDKDGNYTYSYEKGLKVILLNSKLRNVERRNFSFCHEIMHDRIREDDEFYEKLHDFSEHMSDLEHEALIERVCNEGAAEMLMPTSKMSAMIDTKGFSVFRIPEFCQLFGASSLAVAFKMISLVPYSCYLIIGETRSFLDARNNKIPIHANLTKDWELWVAYAGQSRKAKYTLGKNIPVLPGHIMYEALANVGEVIEGKDDIPRRNSKKKRWEMYCDCLAYGNWVFAFFYDKQHVSPKSVFGKNKKL